MKSLFYGSIMALILTMIHPCLSFADLSLCLTMNEKHSPEALIYTQRIQPEEILARLAYAEGKSTGFMDDPLVYRGIAWGVMNRVRLARVSRQMQKNFGKGIDGVIFKKGQFNPAVSRRSPFVKDFLCPDDPGRWQLAKAGAEEAIRGKGNPFIRTEWEKKTGLSLVVNFYYPKSIQARSPLAPWEQNRALAFAGDVSFDNYVLSAEKIRFYRLAKPPADVVALDNLSKQSE